MRTTAVDAKTSQSTRKETAARGELMEFDMRAQVIFCATFS